jgi:hypothetical protein
MRTCTCAFACYHLRVSLPQLCVLPRGECCAHLVASCSAATALLLLLLSCTAPCEALLCLANLFIVLGLRDALAAANTAKEQQAADPDNAGAEGDSRTTGNSNSSKALRALPSRFDSSSSTQHSRNRLGYAAESRLRFGAAVQRRTIPAVVVHMPLRVLCSSSSGLSCLGTLRS